MGSSSLRAAFGSLRRMIVAVLVDLELSELVQGVGLAVVEVLVREEVNPLDLVGADE